MLSLRDAKLGGDGAVRIPEVAIMSVRADRPASELERADTLESLRGVELVDHTGPIGNVADDVTFDGESVRASIVLRDVATIARLPAVDVRAEYQAKTDANGNERAISFVRVHLV